MRLRITILIVALTVVGSACTSDDGGAAVPSTAAGEDAGGRPATSDTAAQSSTTTTEPSGEDTVSDVATAAELLIGAGDQEPPAIRLVSGGETATEQIGPGGGALSAASDDGLTFTLTIPPTALLAATEITMTPLDLSGDPLFGGRSSGAVRLEPDGLTFLAPATLRIDGLAGGSGPIGIGAEGDGRGAYLTPAAKAGSGIAVEIMHFSLVGVTAKDELNELVDAFTDVQLEAEERARTVIGVAELVGSPAAAVHAAFVAWAAELEIILRSISQPEDLEKATAGMLAFFFELDRTRRLLGEESLPTAVIQAGQRLLDLWFDKVQVEIEQLAESCDAPTKALAIHRWRLLGAAIVQIFRLDRAGVLDGWHALAVSCSRFEVKWDSTVTLTDARGAATVVRATSTVDIDGSLLDDPDPSRLTSSTIAVVGEGAVRITQLEYEACETLAAEPGTVGAAISFEGQLPNVGSPWSGQITRLRVFLGVSENPVARCPQQAGELTIEGPNWALQFWKVPLSVINSRRVGEPGEFWGFALEPEQDRGEMGSIHLQEDARVGDTSGEVEQEITITHIPPG